MQGPRNTCFSHLNACEMHIFQCEMSSIPTATFKFLKKETAFLTKNPQEVPMYTKILNQAKTYPPRKKSQSKYI